MIDPFAPTGKPDFKRDRYNRPLVVPAGGGKPKAYTRASGIAKTIEDTYNLERYSQRNVAAGMASDSSLIARMLAVGADPHQWDQSTKQQVNEIVDAAQTAAKAHRSADIGTAIHAMVERLNLGETVDGGPYQADLDAYRQAVDQLGWRIDPALVECRMVCDELEAAGTCDLIVHGLDQRYVIDGERYRIADLKTGTSIQYAVLGYAAQLAVYANSDLYDPTDDTRTQLNIDTEVGYLIHLPAGQGRCDIYAVDLDMGYKAAKLANQVRRVRSAAKSWVTPVLSVTPPTSSWLIPGEAA